LVIIGEDWIEEIGEIRGAREDGGDVEDWTCPTSTPPTSSIQDSGFKALTIRVGRTMPLNRSSDGAIYQLADTLPYPTPRSQTRSSINTWAGMRLESRCRVN